jgi:hypothetical protein
MKAICLFSVPLSKCAKLYKKKATQERERIQPHHKFAKTRAGTTPKDNKGCVTACGLAIYMKRTLSQKKNHRNSNISPCKNIIFQKSSKRNQNPSRYYYNSIITNLKFQHKPKCHVSKILI